MDEKVLFNNPSEQEAEQNPAQEEVPAEGAAVDQSNQDQSVNAPEATGEEQATEEGSQTVEEEAPPGFLGGSCGGG